MREVIHQIQITEYSTGQMIWLLQQISGSEQVDQSNTMYGPYIDPYSNQPTLKK